jgi:hypothetical protein
MFVCGVSFGGIYHVKNLVHKRDGTPRDAQGRSDRGCAASQGLAGARNLLESEQMEIFSTTAFTRAISEGWGGRFALIEGKRCQIVRTHYRATNPNLPKDVYIGLYLPRREWADFVIYVVRRIEPMEFYVVPRGLLSKDTALSS